jgi:hypothetical protein
VPKVPLPASGHALVVATTDPNAWVGVPVGIREVAYPPPLGPAPRGGPAPRPTEGSAAGIAAAAAEARDAEVRPTFRTAYTWLPAKLVREAIIDVAAAEESATGINRLNGKNTADKAPPTAAS